MSDPKRATVRIAFPDAEAADTARQALEPDNDGHLDAVVDGTELVLTTESESIMGLLRTIDDALGCLRATGIE